MEGGFAYIRSHLLSAVHFSMENVARSLIWKQNKARPKSTNLPTYRGTNTMMASCSRPSAGLDMQLTLFHCHSYHHHLLLCSFIIIRLFLSRSAPLLHFSHSFFFCHVMSQNKKECSAIFPYFFCLFSSLSPYPFTFVSPCLFSTHVVSIHLTLHYLALAIYCQL